MAWVKTDGMSCSLGNGRISVTFSEDGKATSVVVDGRELLVNLSGADADPDREHSFYCDYHVGGKTRNLVPTRLEVVASTPELAHVAYVDDESPLKLAYHLVIADETPAVYGYVVAGTDEPDVVINELRTVYRFDSSLLTTGYTDAREGLQPRAQYMAKEGEWLQDETYRLADGTRYSNSSVYSKYDYAGYFAENELWGQWSGGRGDDEWGAWFIPLDKSCYPTGPLKQELLVHYDCIILNYLTGAHFGTGDFVVPEGWLKAYGPWCLYINHGPDPVADAHARAAAERAALPAAWLDEPGLYSGDYASLSGVLELAHPVDHSRGWTVVATDAPGDYFDQKAGRIYYARTDGASVPDVDRFELTGLQPGRYWLRARLNATTDAQEHDLGTFDLAPGEALDAGAIAVPNVVRPLVWNLGLHTGTTEGFKFSDQPRNYVWMGLTPKNHTYRVGTDDDWYYLQRNDGAWSIEFARPELAVDRYLLTVCLAATTASSMTGGCLDVAFVASLNGRELVRETFGTDRAAYRSSVTGGKPQTITVEVPASAFAEQNVLAFTTSGMVMYDMVKLEALGVEA